MTTLTNTLQGFVHHFVGQDLEGLGVPPEVATQVKGVIFANKLVPGRVAHYTHGGFFSCVDTESGDWTYPVALQFLAGMVSSWSAYDRVELLVLITDEEVCQLLKSLGQIGFGAHASHQLENGIALRSERFHQEMYDKAKADPDFGKKSCYTYHMGNQRLHEAEVRDAIWQFRTSSNEKFYGTRNASLHNIIKLSHLAPEDHKDVAFKAIQERWPKKNQALADQCRMIVKKLVPAAAAAPPAAPSADSSQRSWSHPAPPSRAANPPQAPSSTSSSSSSSSTWGGANAAPFTDDFALAGLAPASRPVEEVSRSRASTWTQSTPAPTTIGWGGQSSDAPKPDLAFNPAKVPEPIAESPAETDTVGVLRQSSFEFR